MSIVLYFSFLHVDVRTLYPYLTNDFIVFYNPYNKGKGNTNFAFLTIVYSSYYPPSSIFYAFFYGDTSYCLGYFFLIFLGGPVHHFYSANRIKNYKN
jgi:hypothetical protein